MMHGRKNIKYEQKVKDTLKADTFGKYVSLTNIC